MLVFNVNIETFGVRQDSIPQYFHLSSESNIIRDKFWREILALIYNFTCEITKLPWQRFPCFSAKMACRILKDDLKA